MVSENTYYLLPQWSTIRIADSENPHHWLKRIIRKFDKPESIFTPPDPSSAHGEISEDGSFRNDHILVESSSTVFSKLTKILRLSKNNKCGEKTSLTSPQVQRFRLRNEREVFERFIEQPTVRGELQDWCKRRNSAYMIVGFLAATKLSFSVHDHSESTAKEGTTKLKSKTEQVGLRIFAIE